MIDALDRRIVDVLQGGFPLAERPYADVAARLGIAEEVLLARLERLLADGVLSRFGPLFNAERLGGALTLAAMAVPEARFEEVAALVNAHPEVAHNYAREDAFNMWFVIATERPEQLPAIIAEIERETGLPVVDLPKRAEFFLALRLAA
jgi:DNA-binding Lrp family transcriptional regulator